MKKLLTATALTLTLAACGGGGSGGGAPSGASSKPGTSSGGTAASTPSKPGTSGGGVTIGGSDPNKMKYITSHDGIIEYKPRPTASQLKKVEQSNTITSQDLTLSALQKNNTIEFNDFINKNIGSYLLPNAYKVINLAYARALGLTGRGQTVAIFGSYDSLKHEVFEGKKITTVSKPSNLYYERIIDTSTILGSVIAGVEGKEMSGLAPGADLQFSGMDFNMSKFAPAFIEAKKKKAVAFVYDSIWLFRDDKTSSRNLYTLAKFKENLSKYSGDFIKTLENTRAYRGSVEVHGPDDTKNFVEAMKDYMAEGIFVAPALAKEDDKGIYSQSLASALPEVLKEFENKTIAVANIIPLVDDKGEIKKALTFPQSQCLEAAAYCLSASPIMKTAYMESETDTSRYRTDFSFFYSLGQVAGATAIMAQAFPTLRNDEIVTRLLFSANNRFGAFKRNGILIKNGVYHEYSKVYGHGFLDIEAALKPIGTIGLPTSTRSEGPRIGLQEVAITASTANNGALQTALKDKDFIAYDALATPFAVKGDALVSEKASTFTTRFAGFSTQASASTQANQFASFNFSNQSQAIPMGDWSLGFAQTGELTKTLGLGMGFATVLESQTSAFSLAQNGLGFAATRQNGKASTGVFAFGDFTDANAHTFGAGASTGYSFDNGAKVAVGATALNETAAYLGMQMNAMQKNSSDKFSAVTALFNTSASMPLDSISLFATAELGVSQAESAGIVSNFDRGVYTGFALGLEAQNLLDTGDKLQLSFSQPMHMEAGSATLRQSGMRNKQGDLTFADIEVDLSAQSRQFDFAADYQMSLSESTSMRLGGVLSLNEGHIEGKTGAAAMGRITHHF
ncbi:hypothetical protein [Polycladidibacter stylochi]|uniref:hypothetical protein n=1 Tax=Polycladidibacter stylochi TaxID=1807766 RepID=UPI0012E34EE1|nr:hypothetical protein [Pseudovibrio stylochi]